MLWAIFWPLILSFTLSTMIQALITAPGDDNSRSLALAPLSGIASSSCFYTAVTLARSFLSLNFQQFFLEDDQTMTKEAGFLHPFIMSLNYPGKGMCKGSM